MKKILSTKSEGRLLELYGKEEGDPEIYCEVESWAGTSSLLVWIFGITRNTVNRRFRKPRPRLDSVEDAASEIPSKEPWADEIVEARQVLERCDQVISERLTPLQRRIFHLKHLRHQPIKKSGYIDVQSARCFRSGNEQITNPGDQCHLLIVVELPPLGLRI